MKERGFSLVELLAAIAVGAVVMGAALLALRQGARSLSSEQQVLLSRDQAARALQGIAGELKGRPAAFLLPGASESGAALVVLSGSGWPVVLEGYGLSRARVVADSPDLQVGSPMALVSPTGEVFYLPALASLNLVDASRNLWELGFGACVNPVPYVPGIRAYRAETLAVARTAEGLELRGTSLGAQKVLALKDFALRYVYASPTGEEVASSYQGAARADGSRLAALAFQAVGEGEASRAFTARLPLGAGTVEVRKVFVCGDASPPLPGNGIVNVIVNPEPPGGGDLTLTSSGGYTRNLKSSTVLRDVPVGTVRLQARDVWTDGLTAWAPDKPNQSAALYTFAPVTFTVGYAIVPGTIAFSASGFPADGSATVSAGPYSATLGGGGTQSVSAMPGVYGTSASAEVSVSRSQGSVSWTEVYTLQSVSPAQVTVRSYGSSSVSASYSGPLPGKLCYDDSCSQVSPGAYTKPADSVLDTWTRDGSASCPPGYVGTVTYREYWKRVKYWTPDVVGVSSRGTASFTSVVREEMYNREETSNCRDEPPERNEPDGPHSSNVYSVDLGDTQLVYSSRDDAVADLGESAVDALEESGAAGYASWDSLPNPTDGDSFTDSLGDGNYDGPTETPIGGPTAF